MKESFSIQAGDFLFKNAFPIYDFIYPYFKRKQDKTEIDLLKQHIKPGDIVLDIGANIGFDTSILSQLAGHKGHVHLTARRMIGRNQVRMYAWSMRRIM